MVLKGALFRAFAVQYVLRRSPAPEKIGEVMRRRLLASLAATAAVATSLLISSAGPATAAAAPEASAANAQSAGVTPDSGVPDAIKVNLPGAPQYKVVSTLRGVGKQIYDCVDGKTYTFREPAAGLFTLRGLPAGIHGKGPFWTNFDGSRVDGSGAVSAPSPDPAKNVAWLKLTATPSTLPGVTPTGTFGNVKFIQRIDTRGGQPPATCGAPTVAVDYTANYVFWASK